MESFYLVETDFRFNKSPCGYHHRIKVISDAKGTSGTKPCQQNVYNITEPPHQFSFN